MLRKMLRKKENLYIIDNVNLNFKYNSLYIKYTKGIIYNKTNKKRYMCSNETLITNKKILKINKIPEGIKIILIGQRGAEYLLNQNINKKFNGYFRILIQLEPKTDFLIKTYLGYEKINNIINYDEEKILNRISKEVNIETNLELKERQSEIYNSLTTNKKNILYIGDAFTYGNLKNSFNVINLKLSDIPIIENLLVKKYSEFYIEFLFIESFWEGNNRTWKFWDNKEKYEMVEYIIKITKKRFIKNILYNKEDPIHYNSFLPIAQKVDFVLTSASEMIPKYKKNGVKNVIHSKFFIDGKLFNGFKETKVEEKIFFAGSYYPKYKERSKFMDINFPKLKEDFSLYIYDRNIKEEITPNKYPSKLKKYVKSGGKQIEEIVKETQRYKYAINMNSVIDSETMIARRVYEQIALGKIVISNYSKSIENAKLDGLIFDKDNIYENIKNKMQLVPNEYSDRVIRSLKILRNNAAYILYFEINEKLENNRFKENFPYIYARIKNLEDYFKLLKIVLQSKFKFFKLLINTTDDIKKIIKQMQNLIIVDFEDDFFYKDQYILKIDLNYTYEATFILDNFLIMDSLNYNVIKISENNKSVIYINYKSLINEENPENMNLKYQQNINKNDDFSIVNNIYPSDKKIYAHAFVHTRVKEYQKKGKNPYVFVIRAKEKNIEYYYYDGVLVIDVNELGFTYISQFINIKTLNIHFINPYINNVINKSHPNIPKNIWYHGSDCLLAKNKKHLYDLSNEKHYIDYKRREKVMNIQYEMFSDIFENNLYNHIFVSKWLKNTVEKDYGKKIIKSDVIYNPIDTNYFKPNINEVEKSKIKILIVRPLNELTNLTYSIDVLLELFKMIENSILKDKIEINFFGTGDYAEKFKNQIDKYDFIKYTNKFLKKFELKEMHQSNQIMLMPSRQDTFGVSFYEGVSSGLIGIASNNSAKPEFTKDGITGFLHSTENFNDLFDKLKYIVANYWGFEIQNIQKEARKELLKKVSFEVIIKKELELMEVK